MGPLEILGTMNGYGLGLFTGFISLIRRSRMFHPRGILLLAEVEPVGPIPFPKECLVRLSSAWWKKKIWRDVLGVSLRFKTDSGFQDLLFASFSKPWLTPIGPFLTHYKDFFQNDYYAVSPFRFNEHEVYFKLVFQKQIAREELSRPEIVREALNKQTAYFRLLMMDYRKEWIQVAKFSLIKELNLDQEAMRFNPFYNALGIEPKGYIHHLRIGSYKFSQMMRPKKSRPKDLNLDTKNVLPS